MEFIRSFLVDYLKKKIDLVRKRNFDNPYICFGHSDEVVLFRNVFSKDFYSNDDINDLLICFSDHVMDDYELLAFVSNSPYIFYEMDEASTNIDIRNIILLYLLQSNDFDIILGVFKLFSINLLELVENDDISLYGGLEYGNTLYDLYKCYMSIINEEDLSIRNKKAISFMSIFNIEIFKEKFNSLGISFLDVESFIREYEDKSLMSESNMLRLLNNMLILEDRVLGDNFIIKKVLMTYKEYSSKHMYFNLNEFIKYFNDNYNIDFSSFYYNRKDAKLDIELLYSFLSKKSDVLDSFSQYGEYLGEFKSLGEKNKEWQDKLATFINASLVNTNMRRMVSVNYFHHIEKIRQGIDVTLNYYVYLNIPAEYRECFLELVRWYYDNDNKYFNRDIFSSSDEVKENTFKMILLEDKEAIYNDFKRRKFIHREYLEVVRKMVGAKYISIKDWNEYLYVFAREYYATEGLFHINEMSKLLGLSSLLSYQEENFEYSEFKFMCTSVKLEYPEMSEIVDLVQTRLMDEKQNEVLVNRNYIDELIVARHSQIIMQFIQSDCVSKIHFLKVSGIGDLRFERAVIVVRDNNPTLFEAYRNKVMSCLNGKYYFGDSTTLKK